MPRAHPRVLPRTGQAEPDDARRRRPLRPREPRAQARCSARRCSAASPARAPPEIHVVGGGARNELLCQLDGRRHRPARSSPARTRRPRSATSLVQAIALGELASLDEAREVVARVVRADRATSRRRRREWDEARERFASSPRRRAARDGGRRRERDDRRPARRSRRRTTAGTTAAARARRRSTRSSTARTCSAPTARSRTRAAATPPRRARALDHAGRETRVALGEGLRAPTSRRSRPPASPALRLDEVLPLRDARRDGRRRDGRLPPALRALRPISRGRRSRRCCTRSSPAAHVDHTHPDAVIALTSSPDGRRLADGRRSATRSSGSTTSGPASTCRGGSRSSCEEHPGRARRAAREARPRHLGRDRRRELPQRRSSSSRAPPSAIERAGRRSLRARRPARSRSSRTPTARRPPRRGAARAPRRAARRRARRRARGRPQPRGGRVRLARRGRPR